MVDLPAPDGPTMAQLVPGRNVEVEAFQDLAPGLVAEAQPFEPDPARARPERRRAGTSTTSAGVSSRSHIASMSIRPWRIER